MHPHAGCPHTDSATFLQEAGPVRPKTSEALTHPREGINVCSSKIPMRNLLPEDREGGRDRFGHFRKSGAVE